MPVLYNLTLKKPTGVTASVQGSFSAPKAQEFVVARSHILELYSLNSLGKLQQLVSVEAFGIVRALAAFRLTGALKDYLAVTSDSGRLVILEYSTQTNSFKRIHSETYGKTGVRRIVPGQYLAVDPKGRAIMIGAIERQKFVYILNRDTKANLTISSPLEAHKSHSICFDLVALEVGYENPMFASLEQSYENVDAMQIDINTPQLQSNLNSMDLDSRNGVDSNRGMGSHTGMNSHNMNSHNGMESDVVLNSELLRKGLSFWEMDLGLNHVVKKVTLPVDLSAHLLVPVPGGPGGVLVCCENYLVYKNLEHPDVFCSYPRRLEMSESQTLLITNYSVHKMKDFFFILLLSEYGDLYKIELSHDDNTVSEVVIRYFDTVDVGIAMCILRSGYLFIGSESGDHKLYQFTSLDNGDKDVICTSLHPDAKNAIIAFKPRVLQNLVVVDRMSSMGLVVDMKVADVMGLNNYDIFVACGRWYNSRLKCLRYGFNTEELAFNELPGRPKHVFTIKSLESNFDEYIIISFQGNTLVLSIGEAVEEVTDSFFLTSITTLHCCYMSYRNGVSGTSGVNNSMGGGVSTGTNGVTGVTGTTGGTGITRGIYVQIHDGGYRYLSGDIIKEWKVQSTKRVKLADNNDTQLILVLTGGEIIYFQLTDTEVPELVEVGRRNLSTEITCLAIQHPNSGTKAEFCCCGSIDNIVRIMKLDKNLKLCSSQILGNNSLPESVTLLTNDEIYLYVGLNNGVLIRNTLDMIGNLIDQESRFMGTKPLKLKLLQYMEKQCLILMSIKTYIIIPNYPNNNNLDILPLYIQSNIIDTVDTRDSRDGTRDSMRDNTVDSIDTFNSLLCLNGFVCILGNNLKIFRCIINGDVFSEITIPLEYTPRKLLLLPSNLCNIPSTQMGVQMSQGMGSQMTTGIGSQGVSMMGKLNVLILIVESDYNSYNIEQVEEINKEMMSIKLEGDNFEVMELKNYRAGVGKWSSCIRIINPINLETIAKLLFTENEAATTAYTCILNSIQLLIVGTIKNAHLYPTHMDVNDEVESCIRVYEYDSNYNNLVNGFNIKLLHITNTKGWIRCFNNYENKLLLCAIGSKLRMYSLGKKQMLLKGEHRSLTSHGFMDIKVIGSRIYCGDIRESVQLLRIKFYGEDLGEFELTTTSTGPRWLSSMELLDYSTVIAGDKFDSIFVSRVPHNEDVVRSNYFEYHNQFHLGDIVTSFQRVRINPIHSEVVLYTTLMGSIGVLVPFVSKDELDFLQHLEMLMCNQIDTVTGREVQMFRSYYFPVQNIVDGDLCEMYMTLDDKYNIANQLNLKVNEIIKKLKNIRNRIF
uniref:Splicing factor 3b subunit, putative n=1 Tax=Theileria annulata TaxID=5874 RepID=A0A3B0NA23_THEAN